MAPAVQSVPDAMLPEPPLPDAAPPLGPAFGAPFIGLKWSGEGCFDSVPSAWSSLHPLVGERPDAMQMVWQDNDGVHLKRLPCPHVMERTSQPIDALHQKRCCRPDSPKRP